MYHPSLQEIVATESDLVCEHDMASMIHRSKTNRDLRPLSTILLQFPLTVVKWAHMTGLEPSGDTVEVERVIADTPSDSTPLALRALIRLTFDTEIHDMVPTDRAVVNDNVPCPKSDGVPLLHFEPRFPVNYLRL